MKNTKPDRLTLTKKQRETIRDWFSFVDTTQRTKIDHMLNIRLDKSLTEKGWSITRSEAQLVSRWWYMIPKIILDDVDNKIFKTMDRFISRG